MLSEQQVIELIQQEREYQTKKYGTLEDKDQPFEGFLLVLEEEIKEAKLGWLKNKIGRDSGIHEVLQVAAVAFACLQQHAEKLYLNPTTNALFCCDHPCDNPPKDTEEFLGLTSQEARELISRIDKFDKKTGE
ncbi:MAG: hypothetical protein WC511_01940 [Candidatus Pacearchaeota archaeon]